eukprot:6055495-Amphidinium_carterae.1
MKYCHKPLPVPVLSVVVGRATWQISMLQASHLRSRILAFAPRCMHRSCWKHCSHGSPRNLLSDLVPYLTTKASGSSLGTSAIEK